MKETDYVCSASHCCFVYGSTAVDTTGLEGGREGERERGREGGREREREGGREGGRERDVHAFNYCFSMCHLHPKLPSTHPHNGHFLKCT